MNSWSTIDDLYNAYFQALIEAMTEQYHWDVTDRALQGENFYPFPSGFSYIQYLAVFRGSGETRKVCTELRIAKKTGVFSALKERETPINAQFDAPLCWIPREKTNLIRLQRTDDFAVDTFEANELADIKEWHRITLCAFKAVFEPEIKKALKILT